MKWITCLNEDTPLFGIYSKMLKVAVNSCLKNTNLTPVFIYDGEPNKLTDWLLKYNVEIIYHKSTFSDAFNTALSNNPKSLKNQIAHGAFLRVDIPQIAKENKWLDKYVLYTDCDVMFMKDESNRTWEFGCNFFAVAPEFDINNFDEFNSGSMIMNIENLLKVKNDFDNFILKNISLLLNSAWDQTAYRMFFKNKYSKLDPIYNWKSYWGKNTHAKLIHFHGIKPHHREAFSNRTLSEPFLSLISDDFFYYAKIWDSFLS